MARSEKEPAMRFLSALLFAAISAVSFGAAADDPPIRAGRLAFIEGTVSVYNNPDFGWDQALLNLPITSENSVWTDVDSRAEVRVSGVAMRLDEFTQLDVSQLDEERIDATVVRGSLAIRVRHFRSAERLVFHTPQARFVIRAAGRYRIDSDPERGESRLTVFSGTARLRAGGGEGVTVRAGQSVVIWGYDQPQYAFQQVYTTDFDRWAMVRDERWIERRSTRYVSTYMTGYEDLDQYGRWTEEPGYGTLWIPTRVSADWAPYRYGRWTYVRPWGYTWVDDAPWGYAPFHYGRWVYVRDRWAWYPGQRIERPVWAPALVAWVGGSNWSVNLRSGSEPVVGWYPLSPWERYEPWYEANTTYVNQVNVYVVDRSPPPQYERIRSVMRTQGATVVQRDALVTRAPVHQARVQVAAEAFRQQSDVRATTVLPPVNELARARTSQRQRQVQQGTAAPAMPPAPTVGGAPVARQGTAPQVGSTAPTTQPNPLARPSFAKPSVEPRLAPRSATPPPAQPRPQELARPGRDQRQLQRQQEQAARDTQRQQQQQEQAARQNERQQERAAREAQRQQQQQEQAARQGQRQQEQAARDAERQREQAAREAQRQHQQQQAQQRQQEQAARQAQQEAQRAEREQQQAAREAQRQQQQQQAQQRQQEQAARQAQQQAQRAERERAAAAQQEQRQQQAARQAQQEAQRVERERAAAAAAAAKPAQADKAPKDAPRGQGRAKDKDKDKAKAKDKDKDAEEKEKEEQEKGRGRGRG